MARALNSPFCFGLAGWSGAGKTTLAEKLISSLVSQGFSVATIKHAHHEFDADVLGKDSWRHRKAGACQVIVSSAQRSAHFSEHRGTEPSLERLIEQLGPCDIIMVEGYKSEAVPKIEIHRSETGAPFLYRDDSHIIALACDVIPENCPIPYFDIDDEAAIVAFVLALRHKTDLSMDDPL
ncbi:MAG: Molybdopterin-guanine dinucleotide biosynthesis adapter protein [Alphaproteobacteria bacterium UBA4588]|nr:MAG: Molybdopterin-guanine dinucleotide biosynthesis adapter protein [Alphaproteobacteria bacterium UBA4588]